MKTSFALTFVLALLISSQADARPRHHRALATGFSPECNVTMPCVGAPLPSYASSTGGLQPRLYSLTERGKKRYPEQASIDIFGNGSYLNPAKAARAVGRAVIGATGLVPTLANKVSEITSSCRANIVSGVRHTNIAGTRVPSLHNYGEAVDISGDYGCIRGHLAGWPGGYSVDNERMRHIHISYSPETGREMGARFVHGGHRRYARHRHIHYAHVRRHRYASAR